jgi:hypothetical protein
MTSEERLYLLTINTRAGSRNVELMPERVDREILKRNGNQEIIHTVSLGLIYTTDISSP